MRGYQVNKVLNFSVPVFTRLPGLSGYVLVPTCRRKQSITASVGKMMASLEAIFFMTDTIDLTGNRVETRAGKSSILFT